MKFNRSIFVRSFILISLIASLTGLSSHLQADTGTCGGVTITLPFNDVMASPFFCQIAAAYYSGLTNGTTATTYSPTQTVTREQMAAFISRTMDQSLKRGSRKAVTKKWWSPQDANNVTLTDLGSNPYLVEFDGTDIWAAIAGNGSVVRIRPSDGKVIGTWTGATGALGIVCAMGRIFVTGETNPGSLYMIDPTQPAGAVTVLTNSLGNSPESIAFDGSRIWTVGGDTVSIVSLNPTTVTTVSAGFNSLRGILYDGANIWVTDHIANTVIKLNSDGSIAQTINVGDRPVHPVFDGTNIWIPNRISDTVTVVRVKDAQGNPMASAFIRATLTGNGLDDPFTAAFDGERILVTNNLTHSVSLWRAADLIRLGSFPIGGGANPIGACSDGLNFWIALSNPNKLARF